MEGTHKPIKAASSFSPEKCKISENISDRIADKKINLSTNVNFENIFFFKCNYFIFNNLRF